MNRFVCSLVIGLACSAALAQNAPQFETRTHQEGDKKLPYRLLVPRDYDAAKSWPLIIWLHGSGEKGNNNTAQLSGITNTFLGNRDKCPALVIVPQCPDNSSWLAIGLNEPPKITEPSRMIIATISELQKKFNLDDRRIYIGGFSMGGCGSWDILSRYPNLFAAAFPIAGPPGDRKGLAPLIKDVPIWVFHGDRDNVAPVDSSRTIVNQLKAAGSPVKYTEYRGGGHECSTTLADPKLQEWLFAQRRTSAPDFTESKVPADASLITKTIAQGTRDTWTGKVEHTRHNIPRLVIDEVRYSLKPAAQAPAEVATLLAKIAKGEVKGDHTVTGTIQLDERPWILVEKVVAKADSPAEATKPINVLLVGNSQCPTIVSNQLLEKLAASDKGARPIKLTGCVKGGASLRSHWEAGTGPDTARGKIASGSFDFVVLQDIYFVEEAAFQPYARDFHKLIKESGAQTVLFGTASILSDYPKGFERLHRLHVAMGKELGVPVVDASQAYFRYFGDMPSAEKLESLFAKDRAHPGLQGSYLYSCGIYSVLTSRSPIGLAAPDAIPADVARSLQETAWAQYQETSAALKK
jgi:predicted esterase